MHAFDILGDPVRRRILELIASDEQTSGAIVTVIQKEFGITQAAVSQHLRLLRENGFAVSRPEGTRRLYSLDPTPLRSVDAWLGQFRHFWSRHLAALSTEVARGTKAARNRRQSWRTAR
jgi:DNA-binding transcriptional ArsR family regulator